MYHAYEKCILTMDSKWGY